MFWRDLGVLKSTIIAASSSASRSSSVIKHTHHFVVRGLGSTTNTSNTVDFTVWDSFGKKYVPLTCGHPHILSWYSCGPTVYDSSHIGHASSYIRQDVIRRILEGIGGRLSVVQLMGVTDIDDKIINKANQMKVPWESISRKFELEFFDDLASLNVKLPHIRSRVTEFIPQIVTFILHLIQKGLAYPTSDGSVYFDTEKFGKYGKLRKLSESTEVEEGQEKKNPKDFAVWKGWKPGEPFWNTPWGRGRPGWHIECSVMASHYFGLKVDIHSGGSDLMFPHHENEEAQCCAHFGIDKWVSHWFHTGHLKIKGDVKMSKSLGNTISIQDFLQENSSQLLRMFCILSKYQNGLEFSPESIGHAKSMLRKFESFLSDTDAILQGSKEVRQLVEVNMWQSLVTVQDSVYTSLKNDFDTPSAVHKISEYIDSFNRCFTNISKSPANSVSLSNTDYGVVISSSAFVRDFLCLVGLSKTGLDSEEVTSSSREDSILSELVRFRTRVRNHALAFDEVDKKVRNEKVGERKELLDACDEVRVRLTQHLGIELKDHGKLTSVSSSSSSCRGGNQNSGVGESLKNT